MPRDEDGDGAAESVRNIGSRMSLRATWSDSDNVAVSKWARSVRRGNEKWKLEKEEPKEEALYILRSMWKGPQNVQDVESPRCLGIEVLMQLQWGAA